ncbi:hypothetical protein FNF27_08190 [Cafeteria roenbergensis]|uniref:Uncharacterized protein n=1 Tax=Cafeteria roenbergensis TaxID=33653 RepID=A0A5A8D7X0_CAFRO|nr:hypothetical protein FNF27_08190 [Cafeteria roenbergensis]
MVRPVPSPLLCKRLRCGHPTITAPPSPCSRVRTVPHSPRMPCQWFCVGTVTDRSALGMASSTETLGAAAAALMTGLEVRSVAALVVGDDLAGQSAAARLCECSLKLAVGGTEVAAWLELQMSELRSGSDVVGDGEAGRIAQDANQLVAEAESLASRLFDVIVMAGDDDTTAAAAEQLATRHPRNTFLILRDGARHRPTCRPTW